MRRAAFMLLLAALALMPARSEAKPRTHVVAPGHTLGKIARRYNVSIEALTQANGISRRAPLRPGQRLTIPDPNAPARPRAPDKAEPEAPKPPPKAAPAKKRPSLEPQPAGRDGMKVLEVPGVGPAYFYEPIGPGRRSLRPVLMYLHGRGGHPQQDCRRWAPIARRLGWLVCPSGPGARGDGRGWNNNWATGQRAAMATLGALRAVYKRRVQLYGNTLIGFSEGAYVAMNVGVREARAFNRWLILAADNDYWGGPGLEELQKNARTIKRVYLITGEQDGVIDATEQVRGWLKKAGIATRVSTPADMGHEVLLERKAAMYRAALVWLDRGGSAEAPRQHVAQR